MDSGTGLLSDSGYIGLTDPVKTKLGNGLCRAVAALHQLRLRLTDNGTYNLIYEWTYGLTERESAT